MKLLHVDSSILAQSSVSRILSAEVAAAQRASHPGADVTYRDLATDPVGHLTGTHLAAFQGAVPADAAIQRDIAVGQAVLDEFLAHYSGHGPVLRNLAAATVEKAMANPLVIVRPQSHQSFLDGLALYKARPDKEYSLTDCISMEAMRQEAITEIMTHDHHFTHEGFTILL